MIESLQKIVAKYITYNANIYNWESIRKLYGSYTYLMFLCIAACKIDNISSIKDVIHCARKNHIEHDEILHEISSLESADIFLEEILSVLNANEIGDISDLYQNYLGIDFVLKNNQVFFNKGKNSRDILGAYYTQMNFAKEITDKAINDFITLNHDIDNTIKIADYSCGGSAFLLSALNICQDKNISAEIYGYDVDPVAVLISRLNILAEKNSSDIRVEILLGNPLLPPGNNCINKFHKAIEGRYYSPDMGITPIKNPDIIVGNPPWEKIRFEEKKFLHHFFPDSSVDSKSMREELLSSTHSENIKYYDSLLEDYSKCKKYFKNSSTFRESGRGEINTYALFTDLCHEMLKNHGIAGLIVKSSLVKMPVYSPFFKKLTDSGDLYSIYMFTNKKRIFNIDSREEFCVIFLSKGTKEQLNIAFNIQDYNNFTKHRNTPVSYEELILINPETGMVPNIKNNENLDFLLSLYRQNPTFGTVYDDCHYGRLVHLTNHAKFIEKSCQLGYKGIYEGKFIEQYTNKYATFGNMKDTDKYKNKASARIIDNPQGKEYPEARYYIDELVWKDLSKNFNDGYVIAWRSLTSATNRRTMLATVLPLTPTCQSIQILQLKDQRQMLHILALFNSIVFDYIVRLKMVGLDLTQTIIKQMPVPYKEQYDAVIEFENVTASVSTHLISRLRQLYIDDVRVTSIFSNYHLYEVNSSRKKIMADIDKIISILYNLSPSTLKKIARSFDSFYTEEELDCFF